MSPPLVARRLPAPRPPLMLFSEKRRLWINMKPLMASRFGFDNIWPGVTAQTPPEMPSTFQSSDSLDADNHLHRLAGFTRGAAHARGGNCFGRFRNAQAVKQKLQQQRLLFSRYFIWYKRLPESY